MSLPSPQERPAGLQPTPAPSGQPRPVDEVWEQHVGERAWQIAVNDAARERVAERKAAELELQPLRNLRAFLSDPDTDPLYRIDGPMPTGANVMLVAQYKAGKSTLIGNTIRSLADCVPFLGAHETKGANVVLLDFELDERTLRRWLRDQGIRHTAAVSLMSLRGHVSTFDILNPSIRAEWARILMGTDVLILDPLRPVLDALGLSEDKDAGRFLVAFDALKTEAGIGESIVVHHMGHSGERSRGDSRLQDWPDVTWKFVREDDSPGSRRYFSAYGRDVDLKESLLAFDSQTRHLTLAGGSRKQAKAGDHVEAVVEALRAAHGGLTQNKLVAALHNDFGVPRDVARDAPKEAVARGLVRLDQGANRANVYTLMPLVSGGERE